MWQFISEPCALFGALESAPCAAEWINSGGWGGEGLGLQRPKPRFPNLSRTQVGGPRILGWGLGAVSCNAGCLAASLACSNRCHRHPPLPQVVPTKISPSIAQEAAQPGEGLPEGAKSPPDFSSVTVQWAVSSSSFRNLQKLRTVAGSILTCLGVFFGRLPRPRVAASPGARRPAPGRDWDDLRVFVLSQHSG